ncbi:MAG: SseB family protein [Victivallales bacterium]|nr:SseB family protein [Victivallales bacterium]
MENENNSVEVDPNTSEESEDGKILRFLVEQFNQERSEEHFLAVLRCLRDSLIWIPGTMKLSDADAEMLKNVQEAETFSFSEQVEFVPDILQNGDDFFFPVFSNCEQMGEYGTHFSTMQKHFFVAMGQAMKKENVCGIVLDAFTSPFVVPKTLFDFIEKLPSGLKGDAGETSSTANIDGPSNAANTSQTEN